MNKYIYMSNINISKKSLDQEKKILEHPHLRKRRAQ